VTLRTAALRLLPAVVLLVLLGWAAASCGDDGDGNADSTTTLTTGTSQPVITPAPPPSGATMPSSPREVTTTLPPTTATTEPPFQGSPAASTIRQGLIDRFRFSGLTASQALCAADNMMTTFDPNDPRTFSDARIQEAWKACGVGQEVPLGGSGNPSTTTSTTKPPIDLGD
jgi:hypothetical protein